MFKLTAITIDPIKILFGVLVVYLAVTSQIPGWVGILFVLSGAALPITLNLGGKR